MLYGWTQVSCHLDPTNTWEISTQKHSWEMEFRWNLLRGRHQWKHFSFHWNLYKTRPHTTVQDFLEQSSFKKYTTCWVFLEFRHVLYLCICVFFFCFCVFDTSSYAVFVCLCILYLYLCICEFDTSDYHFLYPPTILFSKIYHMLGLSGTSSYAVFVYLCVCVLVFVYLCMRHLVISDLISLDQDISENIWLVCWMWQCWM